MRHQITTKRDLRNWVDAATAGWGERGESDVDTITDAIQSAVHPRWGADWTEYLAALPELTMFLLAADSADKPAVKAARRPSKAHREWHQLHREGGSAEADARSGSDSGCPFDRSLCAAC